jgi:hypothetical protein
MDPSNRINALKDKHRDLDQRIEVLYAERVDEKYINSLKKEKLRIKDELNRLQNKTSGD